MSELLTAIKAKETTLGYQVYNDRARIFSDIKEAISNGKFECRFPKEIDEYNQDVINILRSLGYEIYNGKYYSNDGIVSHTGMIVSWENAE